MEPLQLAATQDEIARSYDAFPYESSSFPYTHPDHLATLGVLFGMNPTPVRSCRVLELGCASGGNLIPMACQLPESKFLGTDLSANQVDEGIKLIERLDLSNITLECKDVLDLGNELGDFDYIICHGVFSWVPQEVRDKILTLCREHLTRDGIAYISYNTYPGWHMREVVRHMMRYHVRHFDDVQTKVDQARALLTFLAQSVPGPENPYRLYLQKELDLLSTTNDAYIAHEHLDACNTPLYFHEFADSAERHGLQFLAETEVNKMWASNFAGEVAATLEKVGGDIIQREQYMDFVRNRHFRCTLLCHREQSLERKIEPGVISHFHVAAQLSPRAEPVNLTSTTRELFKDSTGIEFGVQNPIMKTAIQALNAAWPLSLSFRELYRQAITRLGAAHDECFYREFGSAERALMTDLLVCYTADIIELHVCPSQFVTKVSENPTVTPLARCQAETGDSVTNQRHEVVPVVDFARHVIRFLDGRHDRRALLDELMTLLDDGVLVMTDNGEMMDDRGQARIYVQTSLDQVLEQLPGRAILIG